MRATRDQRWAAVYGAAYVHMACSGGGFTPQRTHEMAIEAADEAIAAEPEERPLMPRAAEYYGAESEEAPDFTYFWVKRSVDGALVYLTADNRNFDVAVKRSEAAALARLLARFAETGEL